MEVPRERTVHATSKKYGWGKIGNSYDIIGIKTLVCPISIPLPKGKPIVITGASLTQTQCANKKTIRGESAMVGTPPTMAFPREL